MPIPTFTDGLLANDIGLAMVTDHNDFGGSLELRRFVSNAGIDIKVPVAAEVRTNRGDIVVVLASGVPPPVDGLLSWSSLPDIVRDLDGLIWLPHPYRSHIGVEELAAEVDIIEVFNARCSAEQNARTQELCDKVGAVPAFGADVHRAGELAASSSTTRGVPRFSKRSAVRRPAQNPGLPGGVMSCGGGDQRCEAAKTGAGWLLRSSVGAAPSDGVFLHSFGFLGTEPSEHRHQLLWSRFAFRGAAWIQLAASQRCKRG
jgi:hypothetical protein